MLKAENISFSYGQNKVLYDISLSVAAGEVVTLLGPNGSGKTTLMKCLSGTMPPSTGVIRINNQELTLLKKRQVAQLIAVLFQNHIPSFPYAVRDMVLMGRAPYVDGFLSNPDKSDRMIVEQVMAELGIAKFADRPYTELSGGERQLVLLARALAQQPKVLVLDEPTAPLDFKNTILVLGKVQELAKEKGITVIMCLHDPNHTLVFSDKVALVKAGTLMQFGQAEAVITNNNLAELYGVELETIKRFTIAKF